MGHVHRPEPTHAAEDIAQRFATAWNSADADALASLFTEDADFVNVVGLWWSSRDRIRSAHEYGFRRIFGDSEMTLTRTTVRRLGEQIAVVHAAWNLTGQTPLGESDTAPRSGVISFVVHQQNGEWLAVAAQNTDRVPGAETLIAGEHGMQPAAYQPLGAHNVRGAK